MKPEPLRHLDDLRARLRFLLGDGDAAVRCIHAAVAHPEAEEVKPILHELLIRHGDGRHHDLRRVEAALAVLLVRHALAHDIPSKCEVELASVALLHPHAVAERHLERDLLRVDLVHGLVLAVVCVRFEHALVPHRVRDGVERQREVLRRHVLDRHPPALAQDLVLSRART